MPLAERSDDVTSSLVVKQQPEGEAFGIYNSTDTMNGEYSAYDDAIAAEHEK